jgi:O-antigen ligase
MWLQGLFYSWEMFLYMAVLAFCLLVTAARQSLELPVFSRGELWFFACYGGGYLFHLFWSGTNAAMISFVQVILVGLMVLLQAMWIRSRNDADVWQTASFWNVVLLALYGWMGKGEGLLQSVFGYANVQAALCLYALVTGFTLWREKRKYEKWVYAPAIGFLLVSLWATQARIAWGLAILCLSVQVLAEIKHRKLIKSGNLAGIVSAGGLAISLLILIGWKSLAETTSLRLRFTYYWDALHMLKDHPFAGVGAGGWEHLQYQYQTALYSVVHVHSHLLQSWLDGGLLSLIGFLGFFLLLIKDGWVISRIEEQRSKRTLFGYWLATLAVLVYGFLDIILSFPAVLALVLSYSAIRSHFLGGAAVSNIFIRSPVIVLAILLFVFGSIGFYREWNVFQAEQALKQGNIRTVLAFEEKSFWAMPAEKRHFLLGKAYLEKAKRTGRTSDWEKAVSHLQAVLAENILHTHVYPPLLYASVHSGDTGQSVRIASQMVLLQPSLVKSYESYVFALVQAGRFHEAKEVPAMMARHKQKIWQHALFPRHIPALRPSDAMQRLLREAERKTP